MCGFVGVIDPRGVSTRIVGEMTQALSHRGPDDLGLLFFDPETQKLVEARSSPDCVGTYPFGMGFRRLSILDLSQRGHQPMVSRDGRFAITYNGEVYNFRELKRDLVRRGYAFQSQSDTEVLLYLYEVYGSEMLSLLNGMFAFGIFDTVTQTLFLARDRMGIKPLYYYQKEGRFLYASEVKAFLYHSAFDPKLNCERLSEYFLFRYVAGTESLVEGVRSIEPGTYMFVRCDGEYKVHTYWRIPEYQREALDTRESKKQLAELMRNSVECQLISDVKVGCQLSGGIDSSLVSYWAVEKSESLFDSISIIFRDPSYSEEPYIDHVNRVLGLVGHKAYLEDGFILDQMRLATWHNDFPLSHPNCLGIFMLSKEAKQHVTVLLSGEGSDEVFGGYPRFYYAAWLSRLYRIPALRLFPGMKGKYLHFGGVDEDLTGLAAFGDLELISRIYPDFSLNHALGPRREMWLNIKDDNLLERLLTYEQRTYLVDLLMRQDKMCMAHSVENRVPYLDHRVVEFSKRLPTSFKVSTPMVPRRGQGVYYTKWILKDLAADYYGRAFAYRAKSGFPLPLDELFASGAFAAVFEEYRKSISDLGFCNLLEVDALYQSARRVGGRYSEMLWILLTLGVWWEVFMRESWRRRNLLSPS